ncbi:MAG TPA: glucose 1-dehydrogenase [Acidobacteriaceae bacterium]|jgi:glucose 1-dehydrogenase|nr:glucose 1-dehydrogenase [Acidobacteriaceae bacterium]
MSATPTSTTPPTQQPNDPTDLTAARKFAVPNRLASKVAIVTGASSGIGQAIAVRLAAEGAKVVIDYVGRPQGADDTCQAIAQAGGTATTVQADVTKCEDINKLVAETYSRLGRADILVNNAGVEKGADFWNVTEADYDFVLNVNLKGAFFLTQAFVKRLIDSKQPGRIVNISSVHEDMVFPHFASYAASKGGLRMLMRNLAVELGPHNITCNNVAPGAIITPINKSLLDNRPQLQALLNNIPLGRMGTSAEVAGMVAYLASEEAGYVTGSTFIIDGGLIRNYHEQ